MSYRKIKKKSPSRSKNTTVRRSYSLRNRGDDDTAESVDEDQEVEKKPRRLRDETEVLQARGHMKALFQGSKTE